jgi:general secretion pathway protein B
MSYILDALRRADRERERGAVPGLHAQPLPLLQDEVGARPGTSAWSWLGAGVGAALGLALIWVWLQPAPAPAPPTAAPTQTPSTAPISLRPADAATAPSPAAAVMPAPTPATAPAPRHASLAESTPVQQASVAAPRPAAKPANSARTRGAATPVGATPALAPVASAQAGSAPGPAVSAAPPPPPQRIPALHELPADARRAIPPLVINGSVYSKNAADRFLIVNGQVVHEAQSAAPDVTLETIGPRAAVFSSRGQRFEIGY